MPESPSSYRAPALIVASAMFMEQMDSTILSTALPTMARSFQVSPAHLSVALTSYLLSLAVFIPASGVVADRYGARRVFSSAIVIFLVGSILCAQAPNVATLVAARLLQGAGGAMMVPVGRLVLLRSVERRHIVAAMGWLLTPGLIGQILGPPIGGVISTYLDWRWIFYINVPIGLAGLYFVQRYIPEVREDKPQRFDVVGFVISGVSLASLLFGFETLGRGQSEEALTGAILLVIGVMAWLAYMAHARRLTDRVPILDLSLLQLKTFRLSIIAGSLTRITQGAQPFLLPLMMQVGFGMSPAESGFLTFASAIGFVAMKALAAPVLRRHGFRKVLVWNSVLSSLLYAVCAMFRPDWPHAVIFLVLMVCGLSMSLQFAAYNAVCYDEVKSSRMASANSFYATAQQLLLSVGIGTGALSLTVSKALLGHEQTAISDFSFAFLLVTAVSLLAAPVNARLPHDAGDALSGRRARTAEAPSA